MATHCLKGLRIPFVLRQHACYLPIDCLVFRGRINDMIEIRNVHLLVAKVGKYET